MSERTAERAITDHDADDHHDPAQRIEAEREFLRALSAAGRVHRVIAAEIHRMVGVPSTQVGILFSIGSADGLRVNELAEMHLVDPSVASRQVAPLEKEGLVERRPDPRDGRAAQLRVTDAGRDAMARALAAYHDAARPALRSWTTEEIVDTVAVLRRIANAQYGQEASE